jgi:hypothetical protein
MMWEWRLQQALPSALNLQQVEDLEKATNLQGQKNSGKGRVLQQAMARERQKGMLRQERALLAHFQEPAGDSMGQQQVDCSAAMLAPVMDFGSAALVGASPGPIMERKQARRLALPSGWPLVPLLGW